MPTKGHSSLPPAKKQKTKNNASTSIQVVQDLEKLITDAIKNDNSLNSLADLLHVASTTDDVQVVLKAIYAISRIFGLIIAKDLLRGSSDAEESKVVQVWLWEKLDRYRDLLCSLLQDEEKILRVSSLEILLHVVKHLSVSTQSFTQFDVNSFKKIVHALVVCPQPARSKTKEKSRIDDRRLDENVRDSFVQNWLNPYADVRWYFLRELGNILSQDSLIKSNPQIPHNALSILEQLTNMPKQSGDLNAWWVAGLGATSSSSSGSTKQKHSGDKNTPKEKEESKDDDDWRKFFDDPADDADADVTEGKGRRIHTMSVHEQLHSVAAHKAVFTKCWLALLPRLTSLTKGKQSPRDWDANGISSLLTRALSVFHRGVLPYLTRAVLVMDWVSGCVDYGGVVGMLALNALFILMQEYNLDYPKFYTRLYSFFDQSVLHVKYRARFFRLTELFLSSTHLPAALLASFIKRLSILSLFAPPAAIIIIIPFTYNILKRHPALMSMIHRPHEKGTFVDPFDPKEPDPLYTNAIDSSLWELYSHKNHYYSVVSTLAKVFEEAFTKPNYNMEDFLDHTYATLFETEAKKKIKKEPALEIDDTLYKRALAEQDVAMDQEDVLDSLWSFD